jgi:hypothetical protein
LRQTILVRIGILRGSQPRRVVEVGSEAGVQTRVQSGGSMADEAIEDLCCAILPNGSANVKWWVEPDDDGIS